MANEDMLPDEVNFSKIEEGLYLGNLTAAVDIKTLHKLHISHILTVESKPLPSEILSLQGLHFLYIKAYDMPEEDLLSHFPEIFNFISDGQEKGNVLVHCYFGVSRSACAVIAFLMKKYDLKVEESLERVKTRRKWTSPNSGFLSQLLLYQNLNFNLTCKSPAYRLYRLTKAGESFKRGNFSEDRFTDILHKFDEKGSSTTVKCKLCRMVLLNGDAIVPHSSGEQPKWYCSEYNNADYKEQCSLGIFFTLCDWIPSITNPQGKLLCPKCSQKLGSFNWIKGHSCPCNVKVTPGFFIVPSKVDIYRVPTLPK